MQQPKTNPKNDRAKRDYLVWLQEAKQRSPATVDQARHAIDRLESYTGYKDFGSFNKNQAAAFKNHLKTAKGKFGKPLSVSTLYHTMQAIKEFLAWLRERPPYRRRIKAEDIAYLNLMTKEERQARAESPKAYATLEQVKAAIAAMPAETEIERRDRAVMAFLLLTGMRDSALASIKLKHVFPEQPRVFQDPREVKTKGSKTINSIFLPVGDDIAKIALDWIHFLRTEKQFGDSDPVFPKTINALDQNGHFMPSGLSRDHWANAAPVRAIFKAAFARIGLPYSKPHSIRDTLTHYAYALNLTPEQQVAWSQNTGHKSVLTTLCSYGQLSPERQAEIIGGLGRQRSPADSEDDMADRIAKKVLAKLNH